MSALFETLPIPLEAQIAEVEYEIVMRLRVYAQLVENKRLTQAKADHKIAAMRAVLVTLKSIKENAECLPSRA